jgi:hypothetical protein
MASLNAALATLRRTRLRLADLKGRLGTGFSLDELVPLQSHPKVQGRVRYKMSNPLDDIAAEVGAIVGQYRAVLDQVVHSLIELRSGAVPPQRSQFPICKTAKDFNLRAKLDLIGLLPSDAAMIEKLQPYNGVFWTRRIKELAEEHKHRKLIDVKANGGATFNGTPVTANFTAFSRLASGSLIPSAVAVRSEVRGPFTFKGDGSPVVETLEALQANVLALVEELKPLFDAVEAW